MAETKFLTYAEVSRHNTEEDLYMVIHDKVYNISSFVNEHPGGIEVLLDVAGQDGTEPFEDTGHSDEAREILDEHYVADLRRQPGDPTPKPLPPQTSSSGAVSSGDATGFGIGLYAIILIGGAAAYFGYQYLQAQSPHSK